LLREYRQALKDRLSPPCGKVAGAFIHHTNLEDAGADGRKLVCYDCGVACDLSGMREERLVFLRRLGAEAPTKREEGDTAPARAPRNKARVGDPDAGHRYRFTFEKTGPVALLGHLDLVRELPRIFRRLDIEQTFTGGFRPKPDMTFSSALSLGVMSLDERVDLRLEPHYDAAGLEQLRKRMNSASPEGLTFVAARRLGPGDVGISKRVAAARYLLAFAAKDHDVAAIDARCRELMASDTIVVSRKAKGIGRRIDMRPFLLELRVEAVPDAVLARAGLIGDLLCVEATVAITPKGSMRTSELATLLVANDADASTDAAPPHRAIRVALLDESGAPLT
jgi:radical SAM-linked protein